MKKSKSKTVRKKVKSETIIPLGFYDNSKDQFMFCRTEENPRKIFVAKNKGNDFKHFSKNRLAITFKNSLLKKKIELESIDNIISSRVNKQRIITFTSKSGSSRYLYWAVSKNHFDWVVQNQILKIKSRTGFISDFCHEDNYYIYYGGSAISVAYSSDFNRWIKVREPVLKSRPGFFDNTDLEFISTKKTEKGILVVYDASRIENDIIKIQIGLALFSLADPKKIIWRSDEPIFTDEIPYEKDFHCTGTLSTDKELALYWYSKTMGITSASVALPFPVDLAEESTKKLNRHYENPIISPRVINNKDWMTMGVFNPAAIIIKDKTHLLFRAIGNDGISRIGYAASSDGVVIDDLHPEPVFYLKKSHFCSGPTKGEYNPILYPSGGSWGGCEDPRIVKIDQQIYMTFNAFDGWNFIRVGYTTIKEKDFVAGKWNWTRPKLISPAGEINKNWVIFPEKINGQFAILHSLTPEIQIDYVDSLDDLASGRKEIKSKFGRKAPRRTWDTWIRGAGPPPLKTPDGWLVFYHAIGCHEPSRYKLGVMLLDLKNPKKILARSSSPILLPDMWYENDWKPGIVYACGAVINNDILHIYYGGGDKFVCVATVPLKDFMTSLKNITSLVPFISKVIFS